MHIQSNEVGGLYISLIQSTYYTVQKFSLLTLLPFAGTHYSTSGR